MDIDFKLHGLDQIVDRLSTFPTKLQKRAARTAVRRGAVIFRDAAQAGAERLDDPFTSEQIAANIVAQNAPKLGRQNGGVAFRVGVLGGARQYGNTKDNVRKGRVGQTYKTEGDKSNPGGDTWYWRLVHFGTSRTRAQPFMTQAFERNQDKALIVVAEELNNQIDRLTATNAAE